MRLRDRVPCPAVHFLPLRIVSDCLAQRLFLFLLASDQRWIFEALNLSTIDLQTILYAVELVLSLSRLLVSHRHVLLQHCLAPLQQAQDDRNADVTQLFEVCHRVETRSRTRIAGHENEIACLNARGGPLEVALRMYWLTIFVNTNEGHVDIEAWEIEVVRVATEKRGLEFRHEHETHIGVLLVTIEIVLSALVKRDDVRAQPGGFSRLRFDRGSLSASRRKRLRVCHAVLHGFVHTRGHVFDTLQHVQLETRCFDFFRPRASDESLFREILLWRADFADD